MAQSRAGPFPAACPGLPLQVSPFLISREPWVGLAGEDRSADGRGEGVQGTSATKVRATGEVVRGEEELFVVGGCRATGI